VDFNSEADTANLVAGNPESADGRIIKNFRYSETAFFDANSGNGGAVYAHVTQSLGFGGVNIFIVTVTLDNAIDLSNKDGIQIKFKISWISANTTNTDYAYFKVLGNINADGTTPDDYKTQPTEEDGTCKNVLIGADFATLQVSAEDLAQMGYEGKTQLTFAVFAPKLADKYGQSAEVWFDDISYYTVDE
jgi:hypothetical protein